jgi:hypothetical protein
VRYNQRSTMSADSLFYDAIMGASVSEEILDAQEKREDKYELEMLDKISSLFNLNGNDRDTVQRFLTSFGCHKLSDLAWIQKDSFEQDEAKLLSPILKQKLLVVAEYFCS